jgi:hypothetical protein
MPEGLLEQLRQRVDQVVRLCCTDGEVISAKIEFISEEDRDFICQILATNREDKPAYAKCGIGADFLIRLEDVERLEIEDPS